MLEPTVQEMIDQIKEASDDNASKAVVRWLFFFSLSLFSLSQSLSLFVFNLCEQGCEGRVIISGCERILMILNGRRVTAVIQMSLVTGAR